MWGNDSLEGPRRVDVGPGPAQGSVDMRLDCGVLALPFNMGMQGKSISNKKNELWLNPCSRPPSQIPGNLFYWLWPASHISLQPFPEDDPWARGPASPNAQLVCRVWKASPLTSRRDKLWSVRHTTEPPGIQLRTGSSGIHIFAWHHPLPIAPIWFLLYAPPQYITALEFPSQPLLLGNLTCDKS